MVVAATEHAAHGESPDDKQIDCAVQGGERRRVTGAQHASRAPLSACVAHLRKQSSCISCSICLARAQRVTRAPRSAAMHARRRAHITARRCVRAAACAASTRLLSRSRGLEVLPCARPVPREGQSQCRRHGWHRLQRHFVVARAVQVAAVRRRLRRAVRLHVHHFGATGASE